MAISFITLVDIDQIRRLAENLFKVTGIPIGIMGPDGTIYMEVGWHNICARFHLPHAQARQCHVEMMQRLSGSNDPGCFIYQCGNGMHHAVTPLILDGVQVASIYLGQFFYEHDADNIEQFHMQAKQLGLDPQDYLAALKLIPVYSKEKAEEILAFFQDMVAVIANSSLERYKKLQSDNERAESENKYRHLFETMTQGVVYHDPFGKIISANPAAGFILGLPLEQLHKFGPHDPAWQAVHEDGMPFARNDHPSMVSLHTGKPIRDVVMGVFNPQTRQRVWIMVNATPLFHQGQSIPYQVYVTLTDITDLKRTEEALQESQVQFKELTSMLPQPVFVTDAIGRFTFANQQALQTYGYTQAEIEQGINVLDTLIPQDRLRARQKMSNAIRDQVSATEYTGLRKDGSTFPVVIYSTGIWKENKFCGFRGVAVDLSIIKETEEAARQSMKLFQSLFNTSMAGVMLHEMVYDQNGRAVNYTLLDVNPGGEVIIGIKRSDVVGKLATEVFNTTKPPLLEKFAQVVESGVSDHFETNLPSGRNKHLDISVTPLEKGLFATLINDITGRKRAEDILAESEEKYRALIETTNTGFVILNAEGKVLDANQEYVQLSGHSSLNEIKGRGVSEWTAPYDLARNAAEIEKCTSTGFVRNLEVDYINQENRVTPIEINATLLQTGEELLILALCRDISARKQIERSLQDSEARLLEAQTVSHTGSWDLDLATKAMWGSVEAHRIYGLELTPLLHLPLQMVQNIVESEYRPILNQALNNLIIYGDQQPYNVEFFIIRPQDGQRRAVHSIARLVRDESGSPVRVAGTIQDITERKLVQEEILRLNSELEQRVRERTAQLEAANKELEAFAYSVSHDLRAPLRALNGYSHMLSEDYGQVLDESGQKYLQHISAASINMSRLIDDILKLSRVSRSEMKIETVDLSTLAGQIFADLQAAQPERQVQWTITPGLRVKADSSLMQIALTNLIGNAWKFTSKKVDAQISVGVEDIEGQPAYFVRDNGAGFDMTYQHKLFNAFQRLHTDHDFEGTGIGLAIVQRIIQRHGGRIWAEGVPDKGATFMFKLFEK